MLNIFLCASWPSVCLLWRNVYLGLLPIFGFEFCFCLSSCMSYLYILDRKPLSVISFENIFAPFSGLSFHFVSDFLCFAYSFLCCAKDFSRSHLLIFVSIILGDNKRYCFDLYQRVFCLNFPPGVL